MLRGAFVALHVLSTQSVKPSAWAPLEAGSPAGILAQHPDPLAALSSGERPAVIIRGALSKSELSNVLARLSPPSGARTVGRRHANMHQARQAHELWLNKGGHKKLNYSSIGADLHSLISVPGTLSRMASLYRDLYARLGISGPVRQLLSNRVPDILHLILRL